MSKRLAGRFGYDAKDPFKPTFHSDRLWHPVPWQKPQRVAVSFMGDIALAPKEWLRKIWHVIYDFPQHTFLILTKRPELLRSFVDQAGPLPNVWLGASIEDQEAANQRRWRLLECPAAHHWLSLEPLLEDVDLGDDFWESGCRTKCLFPSLVDQVVVGCESGPGRRPCSDDWVRSIVQQCAAAGVPVWVKQLDRPGGVVHDLEEFPPDLRIRQWAEQRTR